MTLFIFPSILIGCGYSDIHETIETLKTIGVTDITLDKTSISLVVGSSETLTPSITPDNAKNKTVLWNSSNTAIATVSSNGIVTAVAPGSVTITVTIVDGNKTAACTVTVSSITIPVTGVSLNKPYTSLVVGSTETLYAAITPYNATNQNKTWSSSNNDVATVLNSGLVTGISVGTTTITVTTDDGDKTAACTVNVSSIAIPVTGVSLNKVSANLFVGDSETLFAAITPSNATNQNVTWISGSPTVATVSPDGEVTGVSAGSATIIVTTKDGGYQAACTINVSDKTVPVTGLTLSESGTYTFSSAAVGYAARTARTVTVFNTGNQATGTLTVSLS